MKERFSFKYASNEEPINRWGVTLVTHDKHCCLTCGHNSRIVWIELDGNIKVSKKACLFCLVNKNGHTTALNRTSD
jgi:hypothetical protein